MTENIIEYLFQLKDSLDAKIFDLQQADAEAERRAGIKLCHSENNPYAQKFYSLTLKYEKETLELEKQYSELKKQLDEKAKELTEQKELLQILMQEKTTQKNCVATTGKINKKVASTYYTEEDLIQMPKLKDCKERLKNGYYEIRFRQLGVEKSFSSNNRAKAWEKCKAWLYEFNKHLRQNADGANKKAGSVTFKKSKTLNDIAYIFFENNKKPYVNERYYKILVSCYEKHIKEQFGNVILKKIKPDTLQPFFTKKHNESGRMTEDIKTILNQIFSYAVACDYIPTNPIGAVVIEKHYRVNGEAITLKQEKEFVEKIKGDKFEPAYLLMLYSGCRPSEYSSAIFDIENNVVTMKNSKLKKNQKYATTRTIPIFPKLKEVLPIILASDLKFTYSKLEERFKSYLPNNSLKDLRHTFTTRARECGIENEIVSIWTSHILGKNMTSQVYTHFSMEFQQKASKTLIY